MCPERAILSKLVLDVVAEVYRVKAEYDSAKQKRSTNASALALALERARASEAAATRALSNHIKQHGCQL